MFLKRYLFGKLDYGGYNSQAGRFSETSTVFWISKTNSV